MSFPLTLMLSFKWNRKCGVGNESIDGVSVDGVVATAGPHLWQQEACSHLGACLGLSNLSSPCSPPPAPHSLGCCHPHSCWIFPHVTIFSVNASHTCPEVYPLRDCEFCRCESWKCKLKSDWESILPPSGWLLSRKQMAANAGEGVGKEFLCIAAGCKVGSVVESFLRSHLAPSSHSRL